jgi:hypothetical protein
MEDDPGHGPRKAGSLISLVLPATNRPRLILGGRQLGQTSSRWARIAGCVNESEQYLGPSRFTNPGSKATLVSSVLPNDVDGICEVAKRQTIHHNLRPYFGIPSSEWPTMARVWPPRMEAVLGALEAREPHNLRDPRPPRQRIVGACMLESHFFAGLLRHQGIPVRVRAGYFRNIRENGDHIVDFWEAVSREKGVMRDLLDRDPRAWRRQSRAYTRKQNEIDHHIEHWICEYWDPGRRNWRLLDANNTFLWAHSGIRTGFRLPSRYFEHAADAWFRMRRGSDFNPDQYFEEPQDGRSHIRSQLLWDFFNLLNHDIAGIDEPSGPSMRFIKARKYSETGADELRELDQMATLMSRNPSVRELVEFYRTSPTLGAVEAEKDPYRFVSRT